MENLDIFPNSKISKSFIFNNLDKVQKSEHKVLLFNLAHYFSGKKTKSDVACKKERSFVLMEKVAWNGFMEIIKYE